jgi:histidinol-phosphatase
VSTDLQLAFQLADIADAITQEAWSSSGVRSTTKSDGSPVTEADIAAEHAMRSHLLAACPADGFVGEEIGEIIGTSGRRWIVDGIDGTRFFAAGHRTWGTLIALEREGAVVVGVSSSPAQQRRWWATRGGGAFTSSATDGSAAVRLQVSRSFKARPDRVATLPWFDRMAANQQQIIEGLLGAPAADRSWSHQNQVAGGELDACIWFGGDLWDHAAPSILVEEAGGRFTNHQGAHRLDTRTAIYSNALIHDDILTALER